MDNLPRVSILDINKYIKDGWLPSGPGILCLTNRCSCKLSDYPQYCHHPYLFVLFGGEDAKRNPSYPSQSSWEGRTLSFMIQFIEAHHWSIRERS